MKHIYDITHMRFILHMHFVNFKILAGRRLGMMFRKIFGLPNLLARTNKPRLFLVFQNSINMLSFDNVFFFDKHNIFYEILEYCRVRSYDSIYVIFSFNGMFYLFIIIFLNDTCQFLKIDTSIVFYITFDFLHHFARKLYGALEERYIYNLIYRNQEFH